jgi:hypothetical protein
VPTRPTATLALAVAVALAGVLAPGASARGSQSLDGVKKTHFRLTGSVGSAVVADPAARLSKGDPTAPERSECTTTSCDVTTLRLSLPHAVATGRFDLVATLPRSLNARIGIYDVAGRQVLYTDETDLATSAVFVCCTDPGVYQVAITEPRLRAGTYTIVLYDTGGSGDFTMDVTYQARRPQRQGKN